MKNNKIVKVAVSVGLVMAGIGAPEIADAAQKVDQSAVINGWLVGGFYDTPQQITYMKSNFTVPNSPKNFDGQTDYFFPGIQSRNALAILQPVIKYSDDFNGKTLNKPEWKMEAWYATDSDRRDRKSQQVIIHSGDKMYGSVFRNNIRNSSGQYLWTIFINDMTSGKNITFKAFVSENDYTVANPAVMESYGTKRCSNLASSPFTVTNYHTYNATGKEMTVPSYKDYTFDNSCGGKIKQSTPQHWQSLTSNGNN